MEQAGIYYRTTKDKKELEKFLKERFELRERHSFIAGNYYEKILKDNIVIGKITFHGDGIIIYDPPQKENQEGFKEARESLIEYIKNF